MLESGLIPKLHPTAVVAFIGDDSRSALTVEFVVFNVSAHWNTPTSVVSFGMMDKSLSHEVAA